MDSYHPRFAESVPGEDPPTPFAVMHMTPEGVILYVNDFAARLFKVTAEELIGTDVFEYRIPENRDYFLSRIRQLTPRHNGFVSKKCYVGAHNEQQIVMWHTSAVFNSQEVMEYLITYGIPETVRLQSGYAEAEAQVGAYRSVIASVLTILQRSDSLDEENILHLINKQVFADASAVFLFDAATGSIRCRKMVMEETAELPADFLGMSYPLEPEMVAYYESGRYRTIERYMDIPAVYQDMFPKDTPFQNMIIFPIQMEERLYGLFCIIRNRCPFPWKEEDVEQLFLYARILSANANRRSLVETLRQREVRIALLLERYRRLLQSAPVGIVICDETGTIISVNQSYLEIMGIGSTEELIGKVNVFRNPAFSEKQLLAVRSRDVDLKEIAFDFDLVAETGYFRSRHRGIRYLVTGSSIVRDGWGNVDSYIVTVTDNTQNHERQERESEVRQLLNGILSNLPVPVVVKDIDDGFRYVYWNPEATRKIGIPATEAIGQDDFKVYGAEMGARIRSIDESVVAAGTMYRKEELYPNSEGGETEFTVIRQVIKRPGNHRWLVVVRWDVTEEKAMQRELERSYEALKATTEKLNVALAKVESANYHRNLVLSNITSGLVYLNRDFVVQWTNTQYIKPLLQGRNYCEGKVCYRSVRLRDTPCSTCAAAESMRTGKQVKHLYHEKNVYLEITANPVAGSDGKTEGVVLKIDDVSSMKLAEIELRKAKEAAEESDVLKSAFLANMSHEIRTPLNAIVGFSELMGGSVSEKEKSEYMKIIRNNSSMLLQLIGDILDLSKIESNSLKFIDEQVDIDRLMTEIEQSFLLRMNNPEVRLFFENTKTEQVLRIDRNRLTQVITNFLNNAIKFTSRGTIRFGYSVLDNGDVRFYVADSGCGIPQDKLESVFDRFVKLDTFAKGTGLGLSICKSIVSFWEGEIGVDSVYHKGATFWFTVPAGRVLFSGTESAAEPQNPGGAQIPVRSRGQRHTILIAEDNMSNFLLLNVLLRNRYRILHARNGLEAVEINQREHPDIILMDIRMPDIDGYQATEAIRKQGDRVPIIAVTANAYVQDEQICLQRGFNDFVAKPVDLGKLSAVLDKWLE